MALVRAIHTAVSGRTRFKVEGLYRSESLKKHLELRLSGEEGIANVSISVLTGNVLVIYNSNRRPSDIAFLVERTVSSYRKLSPPRKGGVTDYTPIPPSSVRETHPRNN
jgi:hypothetical protein